MDGVDITKMENNATSMSDNINKLNNQIEFLNETLKNVKNIKDEAYSNYNGKEVLHNRFEILEYTVASAVIHRPDKAIIYSNDKNGRIPKKAVNELFKNHKKNNNNVQDTLEVLLNFTDKELPKVIEMIEKEKRDVEITIKDIDPDNKMKLYEDEPSDSNGLESNDTSSNDTGSNDTSSNDTEDTNTNGTEDTKTDDTKDTKTNDTDDTTDDTGDSYIPSGGNPGGGGGGRPSGGGPSNTQHRMKDVKPDYKKPENVLGKTDTINDPLKSNASTDSFIDTQKQNNSTTNDPSQNNITFQNSTNDTLNSNDTSKTNTTSSTPSTGTSKDNPTPSAVVPTSSTVNSGTTSGSEGTSHTYYGQPTEQNPETPTTEELPENIEVLGEDEIIEPEEEYGTSIISSGIERVIPSTPTTKTVKKGSAFIPIASGLTAAAAAGVGGKVLLDKSSKDDEENDENYDIENTDLTNDDEHQETSDEYNSNKDDKSWLYGMGIGLATVESDNNEEDNLEE